MAKFFSMAAPSIRLSLMQRSSPVQWTREHTLIALNLYGKIPFGRLDRKNKMIIDVASRMGRTPDSLAMKLVNLASLDPVQIARGVKGLSRATRQDRVTWEEFYANLNTLAPESEQLLHDLFTRDDDQELDFLLGQTVSLEKAKVSLRPVGSTERDVLIRARRGQQFFRQTVVNAYGVRCCMSDINVPRLLVASHIKPWRDFADERLDPRNGLCLSSLHDAAFDAGLITLDENLNLILSDRLKEFFPQTTLEQNFVPFEGQTIRLPEKVAEPQPEFLRYHRRNVFQP